MSGPYIRPVAARTWYLRHGRYRSYMLRELTCVLVAVYSVLIMLAIAALTSPGAADWNAFLVSQQHPGWAVFHGFALLFFMVYQTIPWFRLAPKAMPLQLGGRVVAPAVIMTAHYAGWVLVTAVVLWLLGVI